MFRKRICSFSLAFFTLIPMTKQVNICEATSIISNANAISLFNCFCSDDTLNKFKYLNSYISSFCLMLIIIEKQPPDLLKLNKLTRKYYEEICRLKDTAVSISKCSVEKREKKNIELFAKLICYLCCIIVYLNSLYPNFGIIDFITAVGWEDSKYGGGLFLNESVVEKCTTLSGSSELVIKLLNENNTFFEKNISNEKKLENLIKFIEKVSYVTFGIFFSEIQEEFDRLKNKYSSKVKF